MEFMSTTEIALKITIYTNRQFEAVEGQENNMAYKHCELLSPSFHY